MLLVFRFVACRRQAPNCAILNSLKSNSCMQRVTNSSLAFLLRASFCRNRVLNAMHILYINLIKCLLHEKLQYNYPNSKILVELTMEFGKSRTRKMKKRLTKENETYGFPINWSVVYLLCTMNVNNTDTILWLLTAIYDVHLCARVGKWI